jgi:hypothetical protein
VVVVGAAVIAGATVVVVAPDAIADTNVTRDKVSEVGTSKLNDAPSTVVAVALLVSVTTRCASVA